MAERTPRREPDVEAVLDLLWKWDFAGLAARTEAPEQYDRLCDALLARIRQSPDSTRAWLARELAENWALNVPAWAVDGFVDEVEQVVRTG
jgi:ubiquinone biosynthesis protein UbiJ